jgi:hypothetical protein
MNTRSKTNILSLIVIAIFFSCLGFAHKRHSGPYFLVSGAGSPAANGKYRVMDPQPTQGFWGGTEGIVCVNDKNTAYLGIDHECYIWANDHSENPAAAESLYMIYSTNPTDGPWNVNVGRSPAPTVTFHP